MVIKQPESMDEVVYFTRRKYEPKGSVIAWAFKQECPKCHKGLMRKPGKRALLYYCPECKFEEPKAEHESKITVHAEYVCPNCGHGGEASTEYQRKSWQGIKAYVIQCGNCKEKLGITKKLKEPKKKPEQDDD